MQDELITATERARICVTHVARKQKEIREMKVCHWVSFLSFFFFLAYVIARVCKLWLAGHTQAMAYF